MRRLTAIFVSLMFYALATTAQAADVDIPFTQFTLDNGLTVIVHEDHKAPIVAVNLWYHVGSKNEKEGRTGFAHLFEHLMFQGSENYNDEYFGPFERIGATGQNGTTSFDRTNYFQNVPTTGVDLALWMESDRMGHLLDVITQERLDEQRAVVQNEKRQRENQPYGKVFDRLIEGLFPKGHPYSWLPIGSMEDLNAATLDDVKEWFRTYYGPNNAVLVLAGDITPEVAREKAERFFGDIPPGPPVTHHETWVPTLTTEHREVMQDRVPQTVIYKSWPAPHWSDGDNELLQLGLAVLGGGKNSRLYERLVYNDQTATSVGASLAPFEISGIIYITASVQPGGDVAAVEAAMDEEIERFLAKGPTKSELQRVRTQAKAGFIRGAERIGGFGGKSDILAENFVYAGSADFYKTSLKRLDAATPKSIQDALQRNLTDGRYVLTVVPIDSNLKASGDGVNRSTGVPFPSAFPEVGFPTFERGTLDNGLSLLVVNRNDLPLIDMSMVFDAGFAADQTGQGGLPGTASFAMTMLDEGTSKRSALEISEALAQLGANLGAGANLDSATVSLNTLSDTLGEALDIYADVILNPAFPADEISRIKKSRLAAIANERTQPQAMALRVLPKLMYGDGHAYSQPLTGTGTEETVAKIDQATLKAFHDTWFKPNNATLVIVGDTTLADIKPQIEARFGKWQAADVPQKILDQVQQAERETLYLIDRPDSDQSLIFAGHVVPPKSDPADLAIEAANQVLGGDFSSRLNMNLREDKGWSYGSYSFIVDAAAQRPFLMSAPVQTDQTAPSIAELRNELRGYLADAPASEEELTRVRDGNTLSLPGRWETIGAVSSSLSEMVRFNLPDDYWNTYADKTRALDVATVNAQAKRALKPDNMIWVVVGDRAKIEDDIRALGLGDIQLIDTDGNPVE
ncbi:MAG: pitrilysin family protein [Pseudomonadota bacterium]